MMGQSTQTKFLVALGAAIQAAGFEPVHNSQWANMGTVSAEPTDGFDPVLRLSYDFQRDTAKFEITDGAPLKGWWVCPDKQRFLAGLNGSAAGGARDTLSAVLAHAGDILATAKVAA